MVYWWLHSRHRGHWPKDQRTGPHRPACKYVCFLMVLDSRCLIQKLKRGSPGGLHVPFLHCIEHRGDAADAWKTLLISSFQMIGIITVRIHCRGLTRAENPNETKWHLIVAYSCIIFASYSPHICIMSASYSPHICIVSYSLHICNMSTSVIFAYCMKLSAFALMPCQVIMDQCQLNAASEFLASIPKLNCPPKRGKPSLAWERRRTEENCVLYLGSIVSLGIRNDKSLVRIQNHRIHQQKAGHDTMLYIII